MATVQFFPFIWGIVMHHISLSIIIKKHRWVNPTKSKFDRIAPALHWVFSFYNHVPPSSRELSCDHVESVVVLVVLNRRRINTRANTRMGNIQLRRPIQYVAYLGPVHHILGVKNRHTWEESK